jgi:hypothetical protein
MATQQNGQKEQTEMIDVEDFSIDKFHVQFSEKDWEFSNKRKDGFQYNSYPTYDYTLPDGSKRTSTLAVRTGTIKLSEGGIPRADDKYCPTEDKRAHVRVPIDLEQESGKQLNKMLKR